MNADARKCSDSGIISGGPPFGLLQYTISFLFIGYTDSSVLSVQLLGFEIESNGQLICYELREISCLKQQFKLQIYLST